MNTATPLDTSSASPTTPQWDFDTYVMVTDKNEYCSSDKPLESLAFLDVTKLQQDMSQHAHEELIPYPCVYEMTITWLSEHIFDYLTLHPHLLVVPPK